MSIEEIDPNRSLWLRQMRLELCDGGAGVDDPAQTRRQQVRTVRDKLAFLADFSMTGNVRQSCAHVGIARSTVTEWRKDAKFSACFEIAREESVDRLEQEARRRALEGVTRPILYKGKVVAEVREFSDGLLQFLLKAHSPLFRDRTSLTIEHTLEELLGASRQAPPLVRNVELLTSGETSGDTP
jgi:hypothetical protein